MFLPSLDFAVVLSACALAKPEDEEHYLTALHPDRTSLANAPLAAAALPVLEAVLKTVPASCPYVYLAVQRPQSGMCIDQQLYRFADWIRKHAVELNPLPRAHLSVVAEAARAVLYNPAMGHIRTARYPSTSALLFENTNAA